MERKGIKDFPTWKAGLDKKRATLIVAVTSTGLILKPALILPRKTRYVMVGRNQIDLKFYGTEECSAWIDSVTMIDWLEEVLLPFVGQNETLLILDSYPAHYSKQVRDYLADKNISLAVIPGDLTPVLQPLDSSINAIFKR